MRAHEVLLQSRDLGGRDPDLGERTKTSVDAVDGRSRVAAGDDRIDDCARAVHRRPRSGADLDVARATRDGREYFEGQGLVA